MQCGGGNEAVVKAPMMHRQTKVKRKREKNAQNPHTLTLSQRNGFERFEPRPINALGDDHLLGERHQLLHGSEQIAGEDIITASGP